MSGINLFLKYAYAPNIRGFCGPRDIEIIQEGALSDNAEDITEINRGLNAFTGALPYLQLIASSNQIRDPFDSRVVEAYWIGNDLLKKVSVSRLYDHLRDRFKGNVKSETLDVIAGQAPLGAKPHHAFHVFDAFSKTGGFDRLGFSDVALKRIDECRIGWGTFEKYADVTKSDIVVKYEPIRLPITDYRLPITKIISNEIEGRKLFTQLKKGDIVTFHWSRISDKISPTQANHLKFWTKYHLGISQGKGISEACRTK